MPARSKAQYRHMAALHEAGGLTDAQWADWSDVDYESLPERAAPRSLSGARKPSEPPTPPPRGPKGAMRARRMR